MMVCNEASLKMDCKTLRVVMFAWCCVLPAGMAWADGAVYTMTNALLNNQVLVYHRASDGSLSPSPIQAISTRGGGSGLQLSPIDSLGSAGSVRLDDVHRLLFVVNAESANANTGAGAYNQDCNQGTITSFLVASDGTLTFADRVASGGLFPNSLTVKKRGNGTSGAGNGDLLYVLNAGGPGTCSVGPNITGFKVNASGRMQPIGSTAAIDPGPQSAASGVSCLLASAQGLSGFTHFPVADFFCGLNPPSFPRSPAQVRFTPDGSHLIVTVKGTNTIYVFPVGANERAGTPTIMQAGGPALPSFFGFTFDKNAHLLVTELFGTSTAIPALGTSAVSSFSLAKDSRLNTISAHVGDDGTAACWIEIEPIAGKYAYVTNNLSANISSYVVATDGSVALLASTAQVAAGPNDVATAAEGGASFLYVVEAAVGSVGAFRIDRTTGGLSPLSAGTGLPALSGAQGLAAF